MISGALPRTHQFPVKGGLVKKSSVSPPDFDAIVIGSGIGGLASATILSRMNRMRVLVLERHFEIGGLTHTFKRGRYKWDVGLHYIGRMRPGMVQRVVMDYITGGLITWREMAWPFERFIYPGLQFGVPGNRGRYIRELISRFPESASQIHTYFRDVRRAKNWIIRRYLSQFLPRPITMLFRLMNRPVYSLATMTLADYLRTHITDSRLAALLATQWGDYGTTPDEACMGIHALVVTHFIDGGFYPEGGSQRIAAAAEEMIERTGGMVLINREVTGIIVENNSAAGVRVLDHRFFPPREQEYRAPLIISAAGASSTYLKFLPPETTGQTADDIRALPHGNSSVALYLGLNHDPAALSIHGENVWINEKFGHDTMAECTRKVLEGNPASCYVSFPSMRDGSAGRHTAVIIAIVDYDVFEKWKEQPWRFKDDEYRVMKERISEGLLRLAERHLPGLSVMVEYRELSTPITIEHFTDKVRGAMYGFRPVRRFYEKEWYGIPTPVKNLYLSGADVCSVGITGAMMGGMAAASMVNGPLGLFRIVASGRRSARRDRREALRPHVLSPTRFPDGSDKVCGRLVEKTALTATAFEFVFEIDREIPFAPGQYARIQWARLDSGSYTIVRQRDRRLTFMIDTANDGASARYFRSITPGDTTAIRLPIGDFTLRQRPHKKVFISTGTGIAPHIAMLEHLAHASNGRRPTVDLLFGCRRAGDNFTTRYLDGIAGRLDLNVTVCVSRESGPGLFNGRVTSPIAGYSRDLSGTDFYISGNPAMVRDVHALLRSKNAPHIFTESY